MNAAIDMTNCKLMCVDYKSMASRDPRTSDISNGLQFLWISSNFKDEILIVFPDERLVALVDCCRHL